jgi:hypothetical protein
MQIIGILEERFLCKKNTKRAVGAAMHTLAALGCVALEE